MRSNLTLLLLSIILFSCKRELVTLPVAKAIPMLKRTETIYLPGTVTSAQAYNDLELPITDTTFNSNHIPTTYYRSEYNRKGKLTWRELTAPSVHKNGYLWGDEYTYKDDTLLISMKHYLKGNLTATKKYYYNAVGHLLVDSNFYNGFEVTTTSRTREYDALGREIKSVSFNAAGDTTEVLVTEYAPNHLEQFMTRYSYNPSSKYFSKRVYEYDLRGKPLSEKRYSPLDKFNSGTDYSYDAAGRLLTEIRTSTTGKGEDRYFYGSHEKPEKMEYYSNDKLSSIKTYYYK